MILAWNFLFRQDLGKVQPRIQARIHARYGQGLWKGSGKVWTGFGEGFRLVFGQDSGKIWARVQARVWERVG